MCLALWLFIATSDPGSAFVEKFVQLGLLFAQEHIHMLIEHGPNNLNKKNFLVKTAIFKLKIVFNKVGSFAWQNSRKVQKKCKNQSKMHYKCGEAHRSTHFHHQELFRCPDDTSMDTNRDGQACTTPVNSTKIIKFIWRRKNHKIIYVRTDFF